MIIFSKEGIENIPDNLCVTARDYLQFIHEHFAQWIDEGASHTCREFAAVIAKAYSSEKLPLFMEDGVIQSAINYLNYLAEAKL